MPILVERSLFKTGNSLAVTVPKSWVKSFELRAGDQVEIVVNVVRVRRDDLVIRAKKQGRRVRI